MNELDITTSNHNTLLSDLQQIIDAAKSHVASTANYELTMMYWHIGERINREVLGSQRAEYGKQIVSQVATQLQYIYGTRGFELRNIRRMMQFAQTLSDEKIVAQLATQLSWSHFVEILPLKDPLAREFYLTMSANSRWGRNQLRKEIDAMLYERTAIAAKPDELIKQLLQLDKSGIKVAQYMTELPPRNLLIQKMRESLESARQLDRHLD